MKQLLFLNFFQQKKYKKEKTTKWINNNDFAANLSTTYTHTYTHTHTHLRKTN